MKRVFLLVGEAGRRYGESKTSQFILAVVGATLIGLGVVVFMTGTKEGAIAGVAMSMLGAAALYERRLKRLERKIGGA